MFGILSVCATLVLGTWDVPILSVGKHINRDQLGFN